MQGVSLQGVRLKLGASRIGNAPSNSSDQSFPARHDRQWLQLQLQQVFQNEFLNKEFRGKTQQNTQNRSSAENSVDAEAVACLATTNSSLAVRQTVNRLTHKLAAACNQDDSFQTILSQRLYVLRCMHSAMIRTWPRRTQITKLPVPSTVSPSHDFQDVQVSFVSFFFFW